MLLFFLTFSLSSFLSLLAFITTSNFSIFTLKMSPQNKTPTPKPEHNPQMSVVDLPDLVLECIFEKLPPDGLCRMASVCSEFRVRCLSDHLWEKHMNQKWSRVMGPAGYREWLGYVDGLSQPTKGRPKGLLGFLMGFVGNLWPNSGKKKSFGTPVDSIVSCYLALESGSFWFPAQVYNRENGHVGFMLSCYDAMLSYDRRTDTFRARYPAHGTRASVIESGVTWDRVRAAPVDTCPHNLHISDCLGDLQPGDQIEIQWRRNKEFPYGWWYGVVGHLETCDGNAAYCRCHDSETVVLEFNQYARGSRWRQTMVSRKDHREEGNEADGFYGGIRKLCSNEEISMWRKLWPAQVLE